MSYPICTALTKSGTPCKAPAKRPHDKCRMHLCPTPQQECAICLENMHRRKKTELDCHHLFCQRCIKKWIKNNKDTCPTCRSTLSVQKLTEILGRIPEFILVLETILPPVALGTPEFDDLIRIISQSVYDEVSSSPLAAMAGVVDSPRAHEQEHTFQAIMNHVRAIITPIVAALAQDTPPFTIEEA